MDIDFNKVINYLCGKEIKEYSYVLKAVVDSHFIMQSVADKKIILLDNFTSDRYTLTYEKERLLIKREDSSLTLNDNFGFLVEISFNNDVITLSNIFNVINPDGIISTTTSYKYSDGFKYVSGRLCLLKENVLSSLSNKQTINSFITTSYEKRSNKFNDLFWDMDLLRKSLLIDAYINKKINIENNLDFNIIYKSLLNEIIKTMKELV